VTRHDPGSDPHPGLPRSYDHTGAVYVWHPGRGDHIGAAIDVEVAGRPLDPCFMERHGEHDEHAFGARWTVAETLAKLAGEPILTWLASHGLPRVPGPGAAVVATRHGPATLWHIEVRAWEATITCGLLGEVGSAP
jgi:hypothetical protein